MKDNIYIEPRNSESKFRKLKALSQELRIPVMEAFLEVEVKDAKGNVTTHFKQRSHSWVRNAYVWLLDTFGALNITDTTVGAGKIALKTTSGVISHGTQPATLDQANMTISPYGYIGGAGTATNGILLGSNTGVESFEDYVLLSPIANGTSVGNLSYAVSQPTTTSYDTPSKTWTITLIRFANNNTGSTTSVNEIGLAVSLIVAGASSAPVMVSRDHLSATVSVLDSGQIKVTYTLTLTFPG